MPKFYITLLLSILFSTIHQGQRMGYGFTITNDIYNRFSNPKDNIASPSNGSVLLNLGAGPKIWIGGNAMTFSLEGQAAMGFFGLSSKDYKGLGNINFPLIAKLNFNGLSGLDKEGQLGLSVGGGVQYSKTEIFGLSNEYQAKGVTRDYFRTYLIQAGYGFGIAGFGLQGFVRYGWNKEKANVLNVGMQWDFNLKQLKKISNKESSL